MCFYHDYGWVAEISEKTEGVATVPTACDECHQVIHPGEFLLHIFQQQHSEDSWAEDHGDDEPFEPGETFEYDRCERCHKLLQAIRAAEEEAGCRGSETQPALGELREAMFEADDAGHYADKAREMFPELAASGIMAARFHQIWHEDDHLIRHYRTNGPDRVWESRDLEPIPAEELVGGEG